MPTAIVTGATGILGREIVRALCKDPKPWTKIHALSRSQKEDYPSNVVHDTLDLQGDPQKMAEQLKGVEGDYVFFCAYLAKPDEQEAADVNSEMLNNFLKAMSITGAEKKMKRLLLTCGMKQYGVHLGRPKNPMSEDDKWLEGGDRPPNFYYELQRILINESKNKSWDWVVTYPQDVIGVAKGNFMNLATSLGLYITISKAINPEVSFPGNPDIYLRFNIWTYSRLHAQFSLWAILEPKCGNQNFNVVNGDVESWSSLWPRLIRRFGAKLPKNQFEGPAPDPSEVVELAKRPPIDDFAAEIGMAGAFKEPNQLYQRIDVVKWSQYPQVKETWQKLAKQYGLEEDAFDKATWGFLAFELGRNYDMIGNMTKARKLGWTGYQDTYDAFDETFSELEDMKILPPRHG